MVMAPSLPGESTHEELQRFEKRFKELDASTVKSLTRIAER